VQLGGRKVPKATQLHRSIPASRGGLTFNYYDESGAWQSLVGKLDDGSKVEYRRV